MTTFAIPMNELSRHIEILLLENDCVIVPGFGGFMAHHKSAEYVVDEGMFYPPQRTLGFNPQLKINDSLLVQSFVEAYDISYPEAVRRIDDEVEEIKQKIAFEGEYNFHGIGVVKQSTDGHFEFEPCTAGLLTPTLYALNSFDIDLINAGKQETITVPVTPYINKVEEEEVAVDTEMTEDQFEIEDDTIQIRMQTVKYIVTAAMILFLFIFSSIPAGRGSSNVSLCSVIDTELISSFISGNKVKMPHINDGMGKAGVDSIAITTDTTSNCKIAKENATSKERSNANLTDKTNEVNSSYMIVLASKVSKSGAEEFVSKLKKNGYTEARIIERGTMRKVVYGKYDSEGTAQAKLRQLREADSSFDEAWISK